MRNKVLIFIDVVAPKNQLHIEAIIKYGLEPHFLVTNYKALSNTFLKDRGSQAVLENKFLKRVKQVNSYLKRHKKSIHHVELHPGGRFSFIYVLLTKLYGLKCICIERGDLLYYNKKGYNKLTRFSMWVCYKFSDVIWYKELYMKAILEKLNKKLFFLHNAIKINLNNEVAKPYEKDITFLWLNRAIPQRRYDWYIEVLQNPELKNTKNYFVGIISGSPYSKDQEYVIKNKPDNLIIADYCDAPEYYYKRAKFFVLPADVVFANNALLECMSYGVVPLVSDQNGSALIIESGTNGYIFNHTKKDFEETVLKAFHLTDEEYEDLSKAAKEKIKNKFSQQKYYEEIERLYNSI